MSLTKVLLELRNGTGSEAIYVYRRVSVSPAIVLLTKKRKKSQMQHAQQKHLKQYRCNR
jgi:hypothetical protein